MSTIHAHLDTHELTRQVQALYAQVALHPQAGYHFPVGRQLAERLGYPARLLDLIPDDALASFAGVGFHLELAQLTPGQRVLDLGCGSGTDSFAVAQLVGPTGRVVGVDMSAEQLAKADRLRAGATNMRFVPGRLEALPFSDRSFEVVISNGVVNLCPDKAQVFREAARVLRPGGRLAAADIVASRALPDSVTCNADLWSACIGGAAPANDYLRWLAAAGLTAGEFQDVPQYHSLSPQAANATDTYGVRAVTYAGHRAR